jgi:hypothetical protein
MDVYLITIQLPVAEAAVPLADPTTDDPGDVQQDRRAGAEPPAGRPALAASSTHHHTQHPHTTKEQQ